jgi:putative cardiolipin synthase
METAIRQTGFRQSLYALRYRALLLVVLPGLLVGCASLPDDFEQVPSAGWPHPEQTLLGGVVAESAPADPELSGVELLPHPNEAFSTRFAIAGLAEKTLDLQYYLWKGDLAGQLLLWRALEAGKLRWELRNPDGSVTVYDRDPGASLWKRMAARILSWLPIEKEL